MVALPLTTDVGRAFTVTVALPLKSPPLAVQLASLRFVMLYVAVELGLTVRHTWLDVDTFAVPLSDQ
jgi:hypothetical protein